MKIPRIWNLSIIGTLLKNEVTEERTFFVLTLLTGMMAALVAVFLNITTHYLTEFLGTGETFTWRAFVGGGIILLISGYITTRKFPSTAGSGIPGVRIALAVYHGKITFGATVAKLFVSILSLSSGFTLGREGPTVAISAGIGSALGNAFSLSKQKVKALVAIGAAGGVAAAFNTPMAAVVFTLEEIVGDLNAKMLGSIIISSVVAAITASMLLGNQAVFSELSYQLNDIRELWIYLVVGLVCGTLGPLWVSSVIHMRQFNINVFRGHRLSIIMLTFCVMAGLSFYNHEVLGSGHDTIESALLSLIRDWQFLLVLFVLKFFATSLCYGSGISGGLFMPTLLMGAILGSLIGTLSNQFYPNIASNIGAYALVGMGAYFAAVIRVPFTSIIMVFELTRDYNIILPLMIANMASFMLAERLRRGSIYERISEQEGVHLPTREDGDILDSLHVEDAMKIEVVSLNANLTINQAIEGIRDADYSGYPVLKNGLLVGMVSTNNIGAVYAKGEGDSVMLYDISERKIVSIYPDQSLLVAFHKLKKYNISRLPVVSRINDKKIVGIIGAEDIVSKFGYHIAEEEKSVDQKVPVDS